MNTSLPAGATIGRYTVRSLLGSGGMGEVYLAWEPSLDRDVALKILRPGSTSDPRRVGRFINEARAASALNHPAIVTIYEIGEQKSGDPETSLHYIAMERIDGVTLADWLGGEPSIEAILDGLANVAEGLAKAHDRGILHRDLKPDNIMVTRDGHVKVLDFGVAKLMDPCLSPDPEATAPASHTVTMGTALVGAPGYRSPEQIEGLPLDRRADVFSFGCVLYECITGRSPFVGATYAETMHNIVHRDYEPVVLSRRDATAILDRILSRCLAKDREGRYDSARDLALDLREASRLVRGTPRRFRFAGFRRLRTASRFAMFVLALAVLGAVISTFISGQSRRGTEQLLEEQRQQIASLSTMLAQREQEIASRGVEIDRLRTEREANEKLRTDLENSYRSLLTDVTAHLARSTSQSSELRQRVVTAEGEFQRFREDLERRNAVQESMERLQRELGAAMTTRADARGVTALIPGSLFRTGESSLAPPGDVLVGLVAKEMLANPSLRVTVEGHTDDVGGADGNLELSQQRADSVARQLLREGVAESRITAIGRGEMIPAFSNATWQGRLHNRRLELVFTHDSSADGPRRRRIE